MVEQYLPSSTIDHDKPLLTTNNWSWQQNKQPIINNEATIISLSPDGYSPWLTLFIIKYKYIHYQALLAVIDHQYPWLTLNVDRALQTTTLPPPLKNPPL